MKKTLTFLIGLALSQTVFAENLVQVYEQAKETNPDLRSSLAEKLIQQFQVLVQVYSRKWV